MFSAVHPTTDIAKILRHVRFVPKCGHSRMLKHIAEFFALEKDIRGRSAEERRLIRQREAGRSPMHSRSGYAQSVV